MVVVGEGATWIKEGEVAGRAGDVGGLVAGAWGSRVYGHAAEVGMTSSAGAEATNGLSHDPGSRQRTFSVWPVHSKWLIQGAPSPSRTMDVKSPASPSAATTSTCQPPRSLWAYFRSPSPS